MNDIQRTILEARALETPEASYAFLKNQWQSAMREANRLDSVQNSNTISASLLTEFLVNGAISKLQNRFAPLWAMSRDFRTDPVKPKAPAEVKFTTTGAVAQTNATNFETGDSIVNAIKITPAQITVSFHVSSAEMNSGLRMDDLLVANTGNFANACMETVMAPITTANFTTNMPLIAVAGTFDWTDIRPLLGVLKKAETKNLILDGEYHCMLENMPQYLQKAGAGNGQNFGWSGIFLNTDWAGAGAKVRGLACSPQALGVLAGLPVDMPMSTQILQRRDFTLPGLELTVAMYSWFNPASRTGWASFDIVIGSSLLDETAGVIIQSP